MKLRYILTSAMAATALTAMPAQAQSPSGNETDRETVSASSLMQVDLTNGTNAFAVVDDFVLSTDGSEIAFVLFQANQGNSTEPSQIGFVSWTNIQLDAATAERNLVVTGTDSEGADQLQLTRAEANTRILSRVLDSDLAFSDGIVRPIEDILFNPETGDVEDVIVEFEDADKAVPAEFVRLSPSDGYSVIQPSDYEYTVYFVG